MTALNAAVLVTSLVTAIPGAALCQSVTPPPEQKAPAASAPPPVTLFPMQARFAFIDFRRVASGSETGKIAARLLKEFSDKKVAELDARNKQLQALVAKRASVLAAGPEAAQLARDAAKLQRELDFARESAQVEFDQMRSDVDAELQSQVIPVVAEIAKEKSLHAVFTTDSNLLYVLPGLDISDEVARRLDVQSKKRK